jgi:hypothetical protein
VHHASLVISLEGAVAERHPSFDLRFRAPPADHPASISLTEKWMPQGWREASPRCSRILNPQKCRNAIASAVTLSLPIISMLPGPIM